MAEGEPIHQDYQAAGRLLSSTIRAEERALLKRIREEYDVAAPVLAIQQQLNKEMSDDEGGATEMETIHIWLIERSHIKRPIYVCSL
jgi:hypothetical protein